MDLGWWARGMCGALESRGGWGTAPRTRWWFFTVFSASFPVVVKFVIFLFSSVQFMR